MLLLEITKLDVVNAKLNLARFQADKKTFNTGQLNPKSNPIEALIKSVKILGVAIPTKRKRETYFITCLRRYSK